MSKRMRKPALVVLVIHLTGTAIVGTLCVGCASSTLPPPLTSTEKARVKEAHLPCTVGVEKYRNPAYSDALVSALRGTHVFDRVDHLEKLKSPPMFTARVEREIYGGTKIPFATLLSFWLIPSTIDEN